MDVSDAQRAAAAERMRRSRARRAAGVVVVPFHLSGGGVALLAELGWLAAAERTDEIAVLQAFARFVNAAAKSGLRPPPMSGVTRDQSL
jgi:hypothetical protein